ncbi:uncharacterized protein SCODWIG_03544 [Saccharomycodes ludwigii]|uniref:Uncharacterized protein n=1 Tax=Saccharomycodes ludwigii TaxID=36035 RepID=A0A376BAT0_9ASCO|nr:uncharacterized protein SCODWIG_03544 [Saccharomycodes ludwigii]
MKYFQEQYALKNGHNGPVLATKFIPNQRLVSAGMDSKINIWSLRNTNDTYVISDSQLQYSPITTIDFSTQYNCLLTGSSSGKITLVDLTKGHKIFDYKAHGSNVINQLQSNSNDGSVYSVGDDGNLKVWDIRCSNPLVNLFHTDYPLFTLDSTSYGNKDHYYIYTTGLDPTIYIWDLRNQNSNTNKIKGSKQKNCNPLQKLTTPTHNTNGSTTSIALSPDKSKLVTFHFDNTLTVRSVEKNGTISTKIPVDYNTDVSNMINHKKLCKNHNPGKFLSRVKFIDDNLLFAAGHIVDLADGIDIVDDAIYLANHNNTFIDVDFISDKVASSFIDGNLELYSYNKF